MKKGWARSEANRIKCVSETKRTVECAIVALEFAPRASGTPVTTWRAKDRVRLRRCAAMADNLRRQKRDRLACQPKLARHVRRPRLAGLTGLEPAGAGVTGASLRSRSFDVSRFSSRTRAIAYHAPAGTDTKRHRSAAQTGTPTGTVLGGFEASNGEALTPVARSQ